MNRCASMAWLLLLSFLASCVRAEDRNSLRFSALASSYPIEQAIAFEVTNTAADRLSFYCVAESKTGEDTWSEWPRRLEDGRVTKTTIVYDLTPRGSREIVWRPGEPGLRVAGTWRFKAVLWGGLNGAEREHALSDEFRLED